MSITSPSVPRTSRTRWGLLAALASLAYVSLASASVVVMAVHQRATVTSRHGLAHLTFGWPLAWLAQDQTAYDPPFPWTTGFRSPWNNPTSVDGLALLTDLAVACAPLAVGFLIVLVRRRRAS
jgi:hypothetical protein